MSDELYRDIAKSKPHTAQPDRSVHYARIAFSWSAHPNLIADACQREDEYWCLDRTVKAVYVAFAGKPVSKIGIADAPQQRRDGLQTANWDPVEMVYVMWVWDGRAKEVEQRALALARAAGVETRGEWVGVDTGAAFDFVLQAAIELDVDAGDAQSVRETIREIQEAENQVTATLRREDAKRKAAALGY